MRLFFYLIEKQQQRTVANAAVCNLSALRLLVLVSST